MLFVGAGASKPFDAPLLSDLTIGVKGIFDRYDYSGLWTHISDSLREKRDDFDEYFVSDEEIDMEVVLSVVDLIVDPLKKAKELGPSLRYLTKNLSNDYKGKKPSPQESLANSNGN